MPVLAGYLGPDVFVPLATIVAAIVGFLLAMGRLPFHYAAKILRRLGVMKPVSESIESDTDLETDQSKTEVRDTVDSN